MAHCINIKHPEYIELLEKSGLKREILNAKISIWQEKNGLDKFPSVEELTYIGNRDNIDYNTGEITSTSEQKQQAQQLYAQYLEQNPNGSVEGFKSWVDGNRSNVLYQLPQGREIEEFVASEKTIRDLAVRMSDRIGIPVRYISDRSQQFKGKLENGTAVVNLAYATLDTPIHEILGHPIIRAIKNGTELSNFKYEIKELNDPNAPGKFQVETYSDENLGDIDFFDTKEDAEKYVKSLKLSKPKTQLYQTLLKELEYGKGKEVFDRIKRDYVFKKEIPYMSIIKKDTVLYYNKNTKTGYIHDNNNPNERKIFNSEQEIRDYLELNDKYTLEEQQEEAIVELLGLYTAGRLDKVKDGKLISLLKRLLKEIKAFMKQLLGQREVEIDKLPDNMTLGDIADLLAYSNSKLILPGHEVVYTTPDNQQFKTYAEASKHISDLAKSVEDVDLSDTSIIKKSLTIEEEAELNNLEQIKNSTGFNLKEERKRYKELYYRKYGDVKDFIEKNKPYEQSKEIIEEWKKVNNIQYNPEEVYSRGQEFVSVVGAYSDFDVNLMMQNLLQHIEDNQKAGGEFTISAFTKPVDKQIGHLEGGGGKIKFKIYPQSKDIKWAANTDVFSGSVWDASEKVSKDKKSELLGVSYTKYPSLQNVNKVQPNLAAIIDDLAHHHNELGISLTGNNFRLEYDEDIPYTTKKIIDSINSILDQKYGKIVKPESNKINTIPDTFEYWQQDMNEDGGIDRFRIQVYKKNNKWFEEFFNTYGESESVREITYKEVEDQFNEALISNSTLTRNKGIQPTQTNETLKESIESVKNKIEKFQRIEQYEAEYNEFNSKKENVLRFRPKNYDSSFDQEYYAESLEQAKTKNWWVEDYYIVENVTEEFNNIRNKKAIELKEALDRYKKEYKELTGKDYKSEYTEQALINLKIAKLKEAVKKYPRSLIRSEVRPIPKYEISRPNLGFTEDELPFQKVSDSSFQQFQQSLNNPNTNSTLQGNQEAVITPNDSQELLYKLNDIFEDRTSLIFNINNNKDFDTNSRLKAIRSLIDNKEVNYNNHLEHLEEYLELFEHLPAIYNLINKYGSKQAILEVYDNDNGSGNNNLQQEFIEAVNSLKSIFRNVNKTKLNSLENWLDKNIVDINKIDIQDKDDNVLYPTEQYSLDVNNEKFIKYYYELSGKKEDIITFAKRLKSTIATYKLLGYNNDKILEMLKCL